MTDFTNTADQAAKRRSLWSIILTAAVAPIFWLGYFFWIIGSALSHPTPGTFISSGFGPFILASAALLIATHSVAIWLASKDQRTTGKIVIMVLNGIGIVLTLTSLISAIQLRG
jgi:hypothetical protein